MTTEQQAPELPTTTTDEITVLKARADTMGITYAPNISVETLRKRVNDALNPEPMDSTPMSEEDALAAQMEADRLELNALVRVVITCMNPAKTHLESELFSIHNSVLRDTRVVPFGKPWHVTVGLLNHIRDVKFQGFRDVSTANGTIQAGFNISAYAVEVLPPLTDKERDTIAKKQAGEGL